MKIIDFRFRPNTPEIINGIKNSSMFKATCEAIGFDKRVPQPLPEIVADLDRRGVELCVVSGRDCETTYGFPANNNSILEFCRAYPNKFLGFWGIDPHKGMDAIDELKLMVENHGFYVQDSERVEKLYAAVDNKNFGLLTDMGNFLCADEDPASAFARVAPYAYYVHAKDFIVKPFTDADPGEGSFRSRGGKYLRGTIVGHGNVPIKQCMYQLKRAGYDDCISIEFEGMEPVFDALRIGLANLKKYWAEV